LQKEGMKGLILDLRDDPGGLLSAAVEISDLFVEEGKIVSTRGRNTTEKTFEAHKEGTFTGFPMAVLVNHNSASASEILAACLQDHDRAVVIGERSFGKGSVQNILDLEDGNSVLKLTVATYWRPSGKNIHRFKNAKETDEWGVTPNPGLELKLSREEYHDWYLARRERDFISSRNKPKAEKPKADVAKKDDKDKSKAEKNEPKVVAENQPDKVVAEKKEPKPFTDKQLDKAVAVLGEKVK
jgi:carboxyl-terminal processing protease